MDSSHVNVVIVGAGFSGLYAAYRIHQREPEKSILILEASDKVGGRIQTDHEPCGSCLKYEYGPMRFEEHLQPNVSKLMKELNIETRWFPPYSCSATPPDTNQLSFEEIQAIHTYRDLSPGFALIKYGLIKILGDQWDVQNDNYTLDSHRPERKRWLKQYGTFQGRLLHQHGLWDTFAHVLSKYAIDYIQQKGSFYHIFHLNPNAADQICFLLDILATSHHKLVTIAEGSDTFIYKLYLETVIESFQHIKIKEQARLLGFQSRGTNPVSCLISLQDKQNISVSCDHLILTCEMDAMKRIDGFDKGTRILLDTVDVCELFKIFVLIENPPFDGSSVPLSNMYAERIPCREIHYAYDENTRYGMVMLYGDVPSLLYWKGVVHNPQHLKNHITHYMRTIFPSYWGNIIDCRYQIWNKTGVHYWKPGVQSEVVMQQLRSLCNGQVHIAGEAYSNYQGFLEGCITSVDECVLMVSSITPSHPILDTVNSERN